MGTIIESTRRHYIGTDADKASIPAGAKSFGDSYHANDKGKQYYWNGAAWKTGLGYEYVARDVAAADFLVGAFTVDAAYHVNGLDLSGIVPVGAVAVQLLLTIKGTGASLIGELRSNAGGKAFNTVKLYTQVVNIKVSEDAILNVDSDRLVDYYFSVGITEINVTVMGWFI